MEFVSSFGTMPLQKWSISTVLGCNVDLISTNIPIADTLNPKPLLN